LWLCAGLLSACSHQIYYPVCQPVASCKTASTVILLPEKGGKPSAVVIETAAGNGMLNQPYQTAEANGQGSIQLAATNADAVAKRYPWLMSLRPPQERRLTVFFATAKAELTPESEAELAELLKFTDQWLGSEVAVTAHSDTTGSDELNDRLSLERAQILRERFIVRGLRAELVEAAGRGKRELLVPTADGVDEPRNRRADIVVH
jgi:outer membrane protein OmpA-like peptidoglycan-associated protein